MSRPPITPAARSATVAAALLRHPDVTRSSDAAPSRKRFGSSALRIDNKIFAMLIEGRLVVKPPQQLVDALSAAGEGNASIPAMADA